MEDRLVRISLVIQDLTDQEGKAIICDSDIPGTLIVKFAPASPQQVPAGSSMKDLTQIELSLRVDTTYPKSTPAYFRHLTPDQTLQEQAQVLCFSHATNSVPLADA